MRVGHPESRVGLSTVLGCNRVGSEEDLFLPTPSHNLSMPLWSGDREHYTLHTHEDYPWLGILDAISFEIFSTKNRSKMYSPG